MDLHDLAYLKRFSDNNTRLMRWSLTLAEFEFDTEYRPGKSIQQVDVFSRHTAAVSEDPLSRHIAVVSEDPPSQENIKQQEMKDSFCQKIRRNDFFEGQYYLDK